MRPEAALESPAAAAADVREGCAESGADFRGRLPWQEESRRRSRWFFWGRLAVTLGLLALIFTRVDLGSFVAAVRGALGVLLLLAVVSNSLALIISAAKWRDLLRALEVSASGRTLLELYTIGFFVNAFLPGVVGGDVVRWQMASRRTGGGLKVAATILAERATGLAALLMLSVPAAVYMLPNSALPTLLIIVVPASLALVGGLALVLNRRLASSLHVRARGRGANRLVRRLYRLHRTLRRFPRKPLLVALGYSVLFYLSAGLTFFLVCSAFGADITIVEAASVQVLIMLLIMIPVSIGGLGVAQAGDVYLLGLLGIGSAEALGISLARMAVAYVYAVVGAVLFLRWKSGRTGDGRP